MASYIERQMNGVTPDDTETVRVQFAGKDGGKSKWISLTPEQYEKVKALLIELKRRED